MNCNKQISSTESTSPINNPTQNYEYIEAGVFFITNSDASVTYLNFIACLITAIIACWIICLNGIVVHTLLCSKVYNDVTDYFVASLSIADLGTGLVMLYITSYSLFQYQNFHECLFRFGLTYTVSHSSFGHILAITIDRYVKIRYPLRYFTIFTKKTVITISSTIWASSIIIGLLPLLGWHKEYKCEVNNTIVCKFFGVLPNSYFTFNLVISIIPTIGTLVLYIGIIVQAFRKQRQLKSLREGLTSRRSPFKDHTWNLVKTVAIIVIVSNLCCLPALVCIALHVAGRLEGVSIDHRGDMITYCGLFIFINSLINPLIYAVKIEEVKKRFKRIFCFYRKPVVCRQLTTGLEGTCRKQSRV